MCVSAARRAGWQILRHGRNPTSLTRAVGGGRRTAPSELLDVDISAPSITRRWLATSPPTTDTCPSPTCSCAATPALPEGLEIDHKTPLLGLAPSYAEQVVICTGRDDWTSRIEEESGGDNLAADLKELLGRGGVYNDPFHNILVTNSSLPSTPHPRSDLQSTSVFLLPSFQYVPYLPRVSFDSVSALVKGYLLPDKLHSAHDSLSPIHRDRLTRSDGYQHLLPGVRDVEDVLVLICGHGGRDMRCGVMAPVLRKEFEVKLRREGFAILEEPVEVESRSTDGTARELRGPEEPELDKRNAVGGARIGAISHIGGHKFAGNVIIYLPPEMKTRTGEAHPLAGHGVWYGRVEPSHVEGLVKETILQGRLVKDKLRGGIDPRRRALRI